MRLIDVTDYGQINVGDVLLVRRSNEFIAPVEVKTVLMQGTDKEEIILSKGKNIYFIMENFLNGKSWVKECKKITNGKMYSISNNQRCFSTY